MCTSMAKILKGTVLCGRLESVLNVTVAWSQIEKKKQLAWKVHYHNIVVN